MSQNLLEISSPEHFKQVLEVDLKRLSVLNFWAPWAEPCTAFNKFISDEAAKFPAVLFLNIEAESMADISESFDIDAVPSFIILRGHTLIARHSGADSALLHTLLTQQSATVSPNAPLATSTVEPTTAGDHTRTAAEIEARCHQLMNKHKVVLFMKGNPSAPKCGFSRQTVGLLRERGVEFAWFDILSDEEVRQGLKQVNDWPTFPQIILNGELVGGLDILREMMESGEWDEVYGDKE